MNLPCAIFGLYCALVGPAKVIDGDTIIVQGKHIRLAGIDAEEMYEGNGLIARAGLASMVAGQDVRCEDTGERSYNRTVAVCWAGGHRDVDLSLNARMVREGYALDCARYSNGKYRGLEPDGARYRLKQKPYC